MGINFGNDKIRNIYVGSDRIKEVYYGSDLVWWKPSYAILTTGIRVDFELENTPMSDLEGTQLTSTVVLNGESYRYTIIKEITFGSSYWNVTSIGNYFLKGCTNLISLDLSGFSNVTGIGNYFLRSCSNLTSLDLSVFSNVTGIGTNFLYNCSNLTSLDLSAFSNVTGIGDFFLYYCLNLTQFKIGAINVPYADRSGFLKDTTALTTILVPMQSVQAYKTTKPWSTHADKITGYWKKPSYAILTDDTRIDFELENTPISNLETTATSITLNGTSYPKTTIKEITFGSSYGNVTIIGDVFLVSCSNLTSLDLSAFSNVTSIGDYVLLGCRSLTSLDLSAFSNVTSIGNYFLGNCSSFTSLDLSAFSNVTSIGDNFLRGCSYLTQFKIGAINVPQTNAYGFLESITALTTILVPMQSVQAYKTAEGWSNFASIITGY